MREESYAARKCPSRSREGGLSRSRDDDLLRGRGLVAWFSTTTMSDRSGIQREHFKAKTAGRKLQGVVERKSCCQWVHLRKLTCIYDVWT